MSKPTQHNMTELFNLILHCFVNFFIFIAMYHTPPGRYGIYHFIILRIQINSFCIYNFIWCFHFLHLYIWIPDHKLSPNIILIFAFLIPLYYYLYNEINSAISIFKSTSPMETFARVGSPVMYSHIRILSSCMILSAI